MVNEEGLIVKVGDHLQAGLFIYDIFWVFFTPVMVSVAKSFDAPIKVLLSSFCFSTAEYTQRFAVESSSSLLRCLHDSYREFMLTSLVVVISGSWHHTIVCMSYGSSLFVLCSSFFQLEILLALFLCSVSVTS